MKDLYVEYLVERTNERFDIFVKGMERHVYGVACCWVKDPEAARDVAQETLIRLSEGKWKPEEVRSGIGLITGVTIHVAREYCRSKKCRAEHEMLTPARKRGILPLAPFIVRFACEVSDGSHRKRNRSSMCVFRMLDGNRSFCYSVPTMLSLLESLWPILAVFFFVLFILGLWVFKCIPSAVTPANKIIPDYSSLESGLAGIPSRRK
jgi:DNA-directed RNA polymerase specialized sigma24 family protein